MAPSAAVPAPIKLEPPGEERDFIDEAKAREYVRLWTEQLLAHRQSVEEAGGGENGNGTTLCDRISLSDKSYTSEAAEVVASFLREPFEGGPSIARGIAEADISDCIAGRMTEEGMQVLKTFCDAFAESRLVDVNLSDNAIGEQAIGACRTVLTKKTLQRLALCRVSLGAMVLRPLGCIRCC